MNWVFKYHLHKRHTSMAKEVSRWPLSTEDRVWLQASSCGIYSGQSGTETSLSLNTLVFPSPVIPPMLCTHLSVTGALLSLKFTALLSNMFKKLCTPILLKYYLIMFCSL